MDFPNRLGLLTHTYRCYELISRFRYSNIPVLSTYICEYNTADAKLSFPGFR